MATESAQKILYAGYEYQNYFIIAWRTWSGWGVFNSVTLSFEVELVAVAPV